MKGHTHLLTGAVIGTALTAAPEFQALTPTALIACSAIGSLLPDIDTASSKLGRKVAPASFLIQLFIGHRTMFHAPLLYAILGYLGTSLFPQYSLHILAALMGIASHILLDCFNPAGIPLLWPIKTRFHFASFRSGGFVDWVLSILLTILLGAVVYLRFFR